MPEAVPGHFCEFVQMSCINYLVGLDPGNVFPAQLRDITKSYSKNTHFRCTVRSICPRAVLGNLPCLHGRADTFFPASNSWRIKTYAREAATSLPTNATAGFGGCNGTFSHHNDPHALSVIYCSNLLYINYIGLILAKIVRHLVEISSDGAGSSFAHSVPTSLKSILFNQ